MTDTERRSLNLVMWTRAARGGFGRAGPAAVLQGCVESAISLVILGGVICL